MALTHLDRQRLYTDLRRIIGDSADTLMSYLPTTETDQNATKEDLAEVRRDFDGLRGEFTELRGEFHDLRGEFHGLRGEFDGLRGEFDGLRGEFDGLRLEVKGEIRDLEKRLAKDIDRLYAASRTQTGAIIGGFFALLAGMIATGFFG